MQAVDREIQREYLATLVISRGLTLNREDTSEVDGYNKLLKQYHDHVFLGMTETEVKVDDAKKMEAEMDVFRNLFSGKAIPTKKSDAKVSADSFSASVTDLGKHVKKK